MKVVRKGVDIIHYNNGDINYAPFVIWKNGWFTKKQYVSTYYVYLFCNKKTAYYYPFHSEQEGLDKLNLLINEALKWNKHIEDIKINKTETKYINVK